MKKSILLINILCLTLISFAQVKETPKKAVWKSKYKPDLIRGPYLQMATNHSMVIRWRTDEKDKSVVRYGTSPNQLNLTEVNDSLLTEHIIQINNLKPLTKYFYAIAGSEHILQQGLDNYFTTLPNPDEPGIYRIGAFGDCGNNSTNQRNVRNEFVKYLNGKDLNAWILLGDNAYSYGKDIEYQTNFFNIYKDDLLKKYPLFPAPGNHDYHDNEFSSIYAQTNGTVAYYQNFTVPTNGESGGVPSRTKAYYSYDLGNIHFLSLDSHGEEDGKRMSDTTSQQVEWMKKDLEANKNKEWVIAYWHHPPYTMGSHNSDKQEELVNIRKNFVPILERYGVDLVLCGHSHSYERSKLMKGHYGLESTFVASKYDLSTSSGKFDGTENSCPYIKDKTNKGTVYVVSGSAGQLGTQQKSFPHDAMYYSNSTEGGAALIEVNHNRLDLTWICADGLVRDHFTMMKNVNKKMDINVKEGESVSLEASYEGSYQWNQGINKTTKKIAIKPSLGNTIYKVSDPHSCLTDEFKVHVTK